MKDAPSVTLNKLYFSVHVSPARLIRTTPHEWGGISRKISDRFPADLPRVGMENDLQDWGSASRRVHPRSRAENDAIAFGNACRVGSSPLTRGKHIMRRGWPTCPGITPKWAGCHPHAYRAAIPRRTHPRLSREAIIPRQIGHRRK